MAAGEGRRMRPVSERWPKPVLPIDGRPVIGTLLRALAAAGLSRAFVVTGHLAEQVEELVGDGSAFGLEVRLVRQPEPIGSADAVRRALGAGAEVPAVLSAADTVFRPGDVASFLLGFADSRAAGALAVRRYPLPSTARPPVRIRDGRVAVVVDDDPENPLGSAPLWALGPALVPFLERLTGPPFELADAYQAAIDDGLEVSAIEIGTTRDVTNPVDLVKENFPYLA